MAIFQRFARSKKAVLCSLFLFVIINIGVFGFAQGVYAAGPGLDTVGQKLVEGLGALIGLVIQLIGKMVALLLYVLMAVAQYNDFIYSTAVSKGWSIVRDICNMFFVLVLLAIAAGTILQQEKYHYSKTLPKLILMAILINFSKTICGLLIDFSQVVMMTFVGAFSAAGPGNFMAALGVQNLLKMTEVGTDPATSGSIFISLLLAVVFLLVALVVVGVITVQLIIRIVALWFLVALSPFAFFLSSLPQGEKYATKWWEQFTNYVLLGPVLAFFLWISLAVTQHAADGKTNASDIQIHRELGKKDANTEYWPDANKDPNAKGLSVGDSVAGTVPGVAGFLLGIIMLLGSLVAAQQLASVGGGMAKGAMSMMGNVATGKTGPTPMRWARDTMGAMRSVGAQKRQSAALARAQGISSAVGAVKAAPARALGAAGKVSGISAGLQALKQASLRPIPGTRTLDESRARNVNEARELRQGAATERAKGGFMANWKADRMEVKAGTHEFGAKVDAMREKLPTVAGKVAQYGAAAVVGGPAGLAMIAPDIAGMIGKDGKTQIASAQNFQRDSIARARRGFTGKEPLEVLDIAEGKKPGPTGVKTMDQMAGTIEAVEKGHYPPEKTPELRKRMQDLGADAQTMAEFDRVAGLKREEAGEGAGGGEKNVGKMNVGELNVGKITTGALEAEAKGGEEGRIINPLEGAPQGGPEGIAGKAEGESVRGASASRGGAEGVVEKSARTEIDKEMQDYAEGKRKPFTPYGVELAEEALGGEKGKKEETKKPERTFTPSAGAPKQSSGSVASMEQELAREQENKEKFRKARKQTESELLHVNEDVEGGREKKIELGEQAKNASDQERVSSQKVEDLKARIQDAKEKKSDESKFGAFDSSGFYAEQDAQRAAEKQGPSPEVKAAQSKLYQETEQNKQKYDTAEKERQNKEFEEEGRMREQRRASNRERQAGGGGESPSADMKLRSSGFMPSLPDEGAPAATTQEPQNVGPVVSGGAVQSSRETVVNNGSSVSSQAETGTVAPRKFGAARETIDIMKARASELEQRLQERISYAGRDIDARELQQTKKRIENAEKELQA